MHKLYVDVNLNESISLSFMQVYIIIAMKRLFRIRKNILRCQKWTKIWSLNTVFEMLKCALYHTTCCWSLKKRSSTNINVTTKFWSSSLHKVIPPLKSGHSVLERFELVEILKSSKTWSSRKTDHYWQRPLGYDFL